MDREARDRRRWVMLDAAVEGRHALCVSGGHSESQREMNRYIALIETHKLPMLKYVRSTMTIIFESEGVIVFVPQQRLRDRTRGGHFDLVETTLMLSYWDWKDIKLTGAKTF